MKEKDQVIFNSALEDIKNKNSNAALIKLQSLDSKYPNQIKIILALIKAFNLSKNIDQAINLTFEYYSDLVRDPKNFQELFETFLADKRFIDARTIALKMENPAKNINQSRILKLENQFRKTHGNQILIYQKRLAHISVNSPAWQNKVIIQSKRFLPLKDFLFAAKLVLRDPFVWEPTKTKILKLLLSAGEQSSIELNWLNKKVIKLDLFDLIQENFQVISNLHSLVDELYGQDDPTKQNFLHKQLSVQDDYLFPYADQVISDPNFWLGATESSLFGNELAVNNELQAKMLSWIKLIQREEMKSQLE